MVAQCDFPQLPIFLAQTMPVSSSTTRVRPRAPRSQDLSVKSAPSSGPVLPVLLVPSFKLQRSHNV